MSSQLSDTSTVFERSLDDPQLSSQLSDLLTESQSDPLKPDRLRDALSSGWSSYLSAQHTSREVATLKRHLEDQVKKVNSSLTLLKRDLSNHQQLTTTTAAETKERAEQLSSEVRQLAPLRDVLPPLQQDVQSKHEQVTSALADMVGNVGRLQGKMEGMDMLVSADISSIRRQYDTALEAIELLSCEVQELKAEKAAAEQKIATLESQLSAVVARQELPEGAVELLNQLLLRQDELAQALKRLDQGIDQIHTAPSNGVNGSGNGEEEMPDCIVVNSPSGSENNNQVSLGSTPSPTVKHRRAGKGSQAPGKNRALPPPGSDLKTLLLHYREEYKKRQPRSDVEFVWTFIEAIDDRALSAHIQTSLAAMSSQWVTMKPGLRRKAGGRCVNIRQGLTWKGFQRVLLKMPPRAATEPPGDVARG